MTETTGDLRSADMAFAYFRTPMRWSEVFKRTVAEIDDDDCFGLAAQLAFYFVLGLFPALLFLVALIAYVPVDDAIAELLAALGTVAPEAMLLLVRDQLAQVTRGNNGSLLTLGIVGALWSGSAATVAIIDALNRAYDVTSTRPWWKRRLLAIGLTVALAFFVVAALALILTGPAAAATVAEWFGMAPMAAVAWQVVRWPLIVGCVVLGVDLVYHAAPNRASTWVWLTPGSVLATGLWIVISLGYKQYVTSVADYTATYGAIGGAVVTMLWFYLSGLAILVGAELNGVIEEARRSASRLEPGRQEDAKRTEGREPESELGEETR